MTYVRDGTVVELNSSVKAERCAGIGVSLPIPYSCDAKLNEKGVALIAEVASLQLTKPAWYLKNGLQLRRVETAEYRMTGAISRRE